MRLRHIEIFQAVLQAGTLTGAASQLNISQPAATKLLQQAERQLGFALFTRARGRLQPTAEAAILQGKIEKIADDIRDLQRLASNLKQSKTCTLRVVSTPTLANALVPKAVARLSKPFPDAVLELFTQHSREMLNSILLREADLGLTLQELRHPGIKSQALCEGSLVVIAPAKWWSPSEVGKPIAIEELAGAPIVGIAIGDDLGRRVMSHLEALEPAPRTTIWVQTYQLVRSLVGNRLGLALVDPFTAFGDGDSVQIRPLLPQVSVSLYAVHRIDDRLDTIQQAFLDHVRELAVTTFAMMVPRMSEGQGARPGDRWDSAALREAFLRLP